MKSQKLNFSLVLALLTFSISLPSLGSEDGKSIRSVASEVPDCELVEPTGESIDLKERGYYYPIAWFNCSPGEGELNSINVAAVDPNVTPEQWLQHYIQRRVRGAGQSIKLTSQMLVNNRTIYIYQTQVGSLARDHAFVIFEHTSEGKTGKYALVYDHHHSEFVKQRPAMMAAFKRILATLDSESQ